MTSDLFNTPTQCAMTTTIDLLDMGPLSRTQQEAPDCSAEGLQVFCAPTGPHGRRPVLRWKGISVGQRFQALLSIGLWVCLALPVTGRAECVTTRAGNTVCPPAETRCVADRYGDWFCSAAGGDAVLDRTGAPVCGAGRCVKDIHGEVMCSVEKHGSAALDRYNKAVCTSGCAPAKSASCKALTP